SLTIVYHIKKRPKYRIVFEFLNLMTLYIYYILSFAKLADLVAFAKTVTFEMETSELYKMNERYYLTILVDIENHPSPYPAWLLARMREFADDSDISRSVLQEYGQVLMSHDAVLNLQKIG
ncbi:adaptor protein MecA, partial [Streptococcus pneumoniae]|uniref:adaptor protein MecA n=1 Tax=Streptococcus pneumoniae TaxID=1313 RepID=UPI001D05623A